MTGVAGKSKGCITCRRRKIKCDLQAPACQNCSRVNRKCEGYDRFPVFINRTTKGVIRRKPLEETKPASSGDLGVERRVAYAPPFNTQAYSPGPQFWSKHAETIRCVSWFWDTFTSARSAKDSLKRQTPLWLRHVISLMSRQPVLDEALLAVSLTRYGKTYGEYTVLEKGRQTYTRALGLLQQSLNDEESAMLDETLATVSVMVLFELLQSTSMTPEGWSNHVSGFASLLEHRGPYRHQALLPRQLFEHSRYLLMIYSVTQRKASVFAEQEWREVPWTSADKSIEQKIFDYGLILGGLLEAADNLFNSEPDFQDVAKLSGELAEISNSIQTLREQSLLPGKCSPISSISSTSSTSSVSSPSSTASHTSELTAQSASPPRPSIQITALGIQLIACATGYAIALRSTDLTYATSEFDKIGLKPFNLQTTGEWFNSRRIALAREICKSSISFLSKGVGVTGSSGVILPLRLAFEQFDESDPEYSQCRALLEKLKGKGMEFVPTLNRNEAVASQIIHHKSPFTHLRNTVSKNGFI